MFSIKQKSLLSFINPLISLTKSQWPKKDMKNNCLEDIDNHKINK